MLHYLVKFKNESNGLQIFAISMAGILFFAFVAVMLSGVVFHVEIAAFFQKLFGVSTLQTANPKKEILEFLGLGIGGFIALYGLAALDKRANAQLEQNKLQVEQNKLTKEGIFQGQLNAAVSHLSGDSESGRIASFYELFHLAKAREDYAQSILDILCVHLRKITDDEGKRDSQEMKSLTRGLLFRKDTITPFSGLFFNLQGANLNGIDFGSMHIPAGDINLEGATLKDANLQDADLENANLRRANLSNAFLMEANLRNANLEEAYFAGAALRGTDLRGANLKEAYLIESEMLSVRLSGAKYNSGTMFPPGYDPKAAKMVEVKEAIDSYTAGSYP